MPSTRVTTSQVAAALDKVAGDIHLQPSLAYPGPYRLAFLQLRAHPRQQSAPPGSDAAGPLMLLRLSWPTSTWRAVRRSTPSCLASHPHPLDLGAAVVRTEHRLHRHQRAATQVRRPGPSQP